MNHSGVFFCKCNSAETAECNLVFFFITLVAVWTPNEISSVLGLNVELVPAQETRHSRPQSYPSLVALVTAKNLFLLIG